MYHLSQSFVMIRGNCTADNIYCTLVSYISFNYQHKNANKVGETVWFSSDREKKRHHKSLKYRALPISYIWKTLFNVISFPCKFCMYFKRNNDQQNKGAISKFRKNQLMEFLCRPWVSSSKHGCGILIHFSYELFLLFNMSNLI